MVNRIISFLVIFYLFTGCESGHAQLSRNSDIPPNYCLVTASVIDVDQTLVSDNPKDPCSKAPCMASIRIDSVIGYGQAFGGVLNIGDTVQVKFAYTTAKTTESLNLNMPNKYEGVNDGTKIKVEINKSLKMNSPRPVYTIYGYEVL